MCKPYAQKLRRTMFEKGIYLVLICRDKLIYFQNLCTDEDETVDVEGDSELEEWSENQKRRTTLLATGFCGTFEYKTIFLF